MGHKAAGTEPVRRAASGRRWGAGAVVALALLPVAIPTAVSSAAATHTRATVTFEKSVGPLGAVLVSSQGRTLYVDIHDHANHVTCTAACARSWPPLRLARGAVKPVAGTGVKGLGIVRRPGHRLQVTWHKRPLYLFAAGVQPGQAGGEGEGSTFFVVTPKGVLRSAPSAATTPTSAPTTTAAGSPPPAVRTTTQPTTPVAGGTILGGTTAPAGPATTSPPPTSPPPTSPPPTSPPATTPPTTVSAGGGVAY